MRFSLIVLFFITLINPYILIAGNKDSIPPLLQPLHKNVIKFNPTPMLLWDVKNITISYERILNPKQSISFELGFLQFSRLFDTIANLVTFTNGHKGGVNSSFEYRFYPSKLNRRPIPAGVFFGPYLTYYGYRFSNDISLLNSPINANGIIKGRYNVINLGVELGYQFIFWKRFSIDLIMIGPSLSYFFGKTNISGELNVDEISEINDKLYDKLVEKYGVGRILSFNKSFQTSGKLNTMALGYRYLIQFGVHF